MQRSGVVNIRSSSGVSSESDDLSAHSFNSAYKQLDRLSSFVSPEHVDYLCNLISGAELPKLAEIRSPGRSIYLDGPFGAFKAKGLKGYICGHGVVDRQPNEKYVRLNEPHIKITPDWKIELVYSSPTAKFSLPLKAAIQEFDCLSRLSAVGAARKPLLATGIKLESGEIETDFRAAQTGVVFSEVGSSDLFLGRVLTFGVVGVDVFNGHINVVSNYPECRISEAADLKYHIQNYTSASKAIGNLRRLATDSGVFRHVAHLGNFLVDPTTSGGLFLSDTDSCLILDKDISRSNVGSQLVRDLASDLTRQLSDLSFRAFSTNYIELLRSVDSCNPIYKFLVGFFKSDVPRSELLAASQKLIAHYLDLVSAPNTVGKIRVIAQKKADAVLCGSAKSQHDLQLHWDRLHLPFKQYVMPIIFQLLKQSKVHAEVMPSFSSSSFAKKIASGMQTYLLEFDRAIERSGNNLKF